MDHNEVTMRDSTEYRSATSYRCFSLESRDRELKIRYDAAGNHQLANSTYTGVDEQRSDSTTQRCSMILRRRRVTALLVDPRVCAVCKLMISGRVVDGRVVRS